ncbi:MAG: GNAT family N-acetyltransferase [Pseudomonadota bacterium]
MQTRKVTLSELDGVLDLIDQFDRPVSPRPDDATLEEIFRKIQQAGGTVVGAFLDDKVIGTCTVNVCANLSWTGRPYAIIENVIVAPDYRRQGVGKALLSFAQKFAQESGCYKVALMTGSKKPETLKFYEAAGFSGNKIGFQKRFGA